MSRVIPLTVTLAGALAAVLLWPAAPAARGPAAAPPWRWPVFGPVAHRFSYRAAEPFARGARRGIDLRVARGAVVRAPCAGRVTFAGAVPSRGRAVTLRCGTLRATLLGLRSTAVGRGVSVRAGALIGRAGGPLLRLGARRADDRFGYVDPLALLGDRPAGAPLGPAPRAMPPPSRHRPAPPPRPAPARAPQPTGPPLPTYLAIALLAAGVGTGSLVRRRVRRLPAPEPATRRPANR